MTPQFPPTLGVEGPTPSFPLTPTFPLFRHNAPPTVRSDFLTHLDHSSTERKE